MRKKYLFAFYIIFYCSTFSFATTIIDVRELFYRASKSSKSTDSLVSLLSEKTFLSNVETTGYKGMAKFMVCYHSYNPYTKLKYFYEGKELLEKAIKTDPNNLELRFLRLTVQLNAPAILMYNSNIKDDKLFIYEGIKNTKDKDLYTRVANFTLNAQKISKEEKKIFITALQKNNLFKIL